MGGMSGKGGSQPMASPGLGVTMGGGAPMMSGLQSGYGGPLRQGGKASAQPMGNPGQWGTTLAYQNGSAGPYQTPQAPKPMQAPGMPTASAPPGVAAGMAGGPTASGNSPGALVRSLFNGQAGLSGVGSQATNADINSYNVGGANYREPSTAVAAMTPQVAQQTMQRFATPQEWGKRQNMTPQALAALPATWAGYASVNPAFGG